MQWRFLSPTCVSVPGPASAFPQPPTIVRQPGAGTVKLLHPRFHSPPRPASLPTLPRCPTVALAADAEDFAFLAAKVPSAFLMLGIRNDTAGSVHGLHTPQFRLDEAALPLGAALHVQFALDFLRSRQQGAGGGAGGAAAAREEL